MSRITVEDCLEKIHSRFELATPAAKRPRQLFAGARPLIQSESREIVVALCEITAGQVRKTAGQS